MVQEMCEVESELLGNPREFWTYRDERFMGVVLSMAHSHGGSATASTTPLRVLHIDDRLGKGDWQKKWTQGRHTCATPHMTPIPKDLDSFAGWSEADVLQVSCGTHRLHDCASVSFWKSGTTSKDTTSEQNRVHEGTAALQPRHTDTRATPHMTPTPKDPDSFESWSDADVLQVLCWTHHFHKWASVVFLAK